MHRQYTVTVNLNYFFFLQAAGRVVLYNKVFHAGPKSSIKSTFMNYMHKREKYGEFVVNFWGIHLCGLSKGLNHWHQLLI